MSELEAAWSALTTEARIESGWHGRRVMRAAPCRIQAAIRSGTSLRALLFEVAASSVPSIVDYPACAGFVLTPETIVPGPGGRIRLVLEQRGSAYGELFSAMAVDVARRVAATTDEMSSVSALLSRLQVWLRFAARFGPGLLSEQALVGLAGELLFLETVVLDRLAPVLAVSAWTGPTGAAQDFRFGRCYVEVKASVALSPSSLRISNLSQLDGAAGMPLFLCHVSMSLAGPSARILPDIVGDLRGRLSGQADGAADAFDDLLIEAGYLDAHAVHYQGVTYASRAFTFHTVEGDFPRLTPSLVPTGVEAASYSLSLASCQPWIVDESACADLIG